jgi:hypothetical protein
MSFGSCGLSGKFAILAAIILTVFIFSANKSIAEPIGETFCIGHTWWEYQWRACHDELLALDTTDNTVYFTWTYCPFPPSEFIGRGYFNSFNPVTGLAYGDTGRWMYPGISNEAFHTLLLKSHSGGISDLEFSFESFNHHTMRGWWQPDSFYRMPLDSVGLPAEYGNMHAVSPSGKVHLLGQNMQSQVIYWASYMPDSFEFNGWQMLDSANWPYYNIACSPVSEKVAICDFKVKPFHPDPYYTWAYIDADLFLLESPDGANWNRNEISNLTHFACADPLRPIGDIDIIIDYNNQTHIAFSSQEVHIDSLFPNSNKTDRFMSYIWHWSEACDSFTVMADGWIPYPPRNDCNFYYRWPVSQVQMAENSRNGYLYAVYARYSFEDCSIRPFYPNGELWATVSTDNGLNWSEGTNISQTPSPNCPPGQCYCEMQPSLNDLVNDTLHIAYILDKDAAISYNEEYWMSEADVIYQKIPTDQISTTPLINQFSIREGPVRCHYIPGEINGDGQVNGLDVVYAVNYFKRSSPVPSIDCNCQGMTRPFYAAGDVNGSCTFNGMDIVFFINHLKGRHPRLRFCPSCPPDTI